MGGRTRAPHKQTHEQRSHPQEKNLKLSGLLVVIFPHQNSNPTPPPSPHGRDARVYGHSSTAMYNHEVSPPPAPPPRACMPLVGLRCVVPSAAGAEGLLAKERKEKSEEQEKEKARDDLRQKATKAKERLAYARCQWLHHTVAVAAMIAITI